MGITKNERIMAGASVWCAYYRHNPARFAQDYLHLRLKTFQKILITMMMSMTTFVFIGARGIGKSFLSAIYLVIRCILYPGSKCCIASGTRGQSINIIEKIQTELIPNSPELKSEILEIKLNGTDARIIFKNGSFIKVVTASDSARGNRATVLLLDEFRLLNKDVVDTVLRKFLTQRRMPRYSELSEAERRKEYNKEKNITIYLSSAWWKDSWAYLKCRDACRAMLDDTKKQFVCGLPYELSIMEGLLDRELVEDDMADTSYNEIKHSMEYESLFYGSDDGSFFDFDSISKNRKLRYPMYPDALSSRLSNTNIRIQPKVNGEIRILSADIALMSSKKNNNDATAIFINQILPTKSGRYSSNIIYCDTVEGVHTEDQALMIRKLYDEYQCDYIVIDTNGVGLGVYDCLVREISDSDTGEMYPPLSCCNDKTMAERCSDPRAEKVIWSVKANAQMNSDCAVLLREGFRSGKIRLLVSEYDAEDILGSIKGYSSMTEAEKMKYQLPYIHTTLLIDELVKLRHDESGGKVKIYEKAGMRKDRYSSLAYNYYVATQLEAQMGRRNAMSFDAEKEFIIRAPKINGRAVGTIRGNGKRNSWY